MAKVCDLAGPSVPKLLASWEFRDGALGIVLAGRGASGVHEHSIAIVDNTCFIAVGDTLCSLALPLQDLLWHRQVDHATCFGVYFSANHYCLISHGKLEIARVNLSEEVIWSSGGADTFSEGLKVFPGYVEAHG